MATIRGSLQRKNESPQLSAYILQKALLQFYQEKDLFPEGVCCALPSVQDWALKQGVILKKLVGSLVEKTPVRVVAILQ